MKDGKRGRKVVQACHNSSNKMKTVTIHLIDLSI